MSAAITRILVPVDGSDASLRAVEAADKIARGTHARLDLVSVLDLRAIDVYEEIALDADQVATLERRIREQVLDKAVARVTTTNVGTRLLKGGVEETVLKEAEGASLVVLGRTGKNAIERMLEGSLSRKLSLKSPVPVMIVP